MMIAIDGPAGSGKGTLAKRLAAHFGLPHLDTGLLYRAVGYMMRQRGFDLGNEALATSFAEALDLNDLHHHGLRSREAGEAASRVAVHGGVRKALVQLQKNFAQQKGGAVLDGRDIGTVIAPDAPVKIFVTASVEERAKRRLHELVAAGEMADTPESLNGLVDDLKQRDARDSGRIHAPLASARDALHLDTTAMDADMAFKAALAFISSKMTPP